jgi:glycosyltransferase involved in cell wall biosynthesis
MYHADLLGAFVAQLAGRPPLVWNIRQSDLDPRLTRRSTRLVARLGSTVSWAAPTRIVCCSERARTIHRTLGYRDDLMTVIPNGFDLERFRPDLGARAELRAELGVPAEAPLLGLVARLDPQKDLGTFIQAARQVQAARPDSRLLLCGQGLHPNNPEFVAGLADSGLGESTHLLGPRSDTPRVFAALDLLVSSSAYGEGFPNVIGEAMACGVPCAVTDVGDSADIVADTGVAVPPRDPQALAGAIVRLLREGPEGLARRGEAARERIADHFSLPRIADRYGSLYCSLDRSPSQRI